VIEKLLIALQDSRSYVRSSAAEALGAMDEAVATPQVIEQLLIALRDLEPYVRSSAADVLSKFMRRGVRIFQIQGDKWKIITVKELNK
jgi:HEAT repeat protein